MKEIKSWLDSKFHRKPRARLISVNDRIPRATVIRHEPRARVIPSERKARVIRIEDSNAEDFIRTARAFLEEYSLDFKDRQEPKGANQFDLKLLTEHFDLFPVVYILFKGSRDKFDNHWNLLVSKSGSYQSGDTPLTVYDPLSGLRAVSLSRVDILEYFRNSNEWVGWEPIQEKHESKPFVPTADTKSKARVIGVEYHPEKKDWAWKLIEQDSYHLDASRIQNLNRIQNSPDCGIYCVYAAKLAKGK